MIRHKDKWVSPVVEAFWKMAVQLIGVKGKPIDSIAPGA
jgi:hypothetical protein